MVHPPVEPPPTSWLLDAARAEPHDDLVAAGADLEPGTLLAAYRLGLFPMGLGPHGTGATGWWSPDPRGVIPAGALRVQRSLRRALARFDVRVDTAFEEVVRRCADPAREGRWITDDVAVAYRRLHDLGWAHSVEAWAVGPDSRQRLVGGLYGVAVGGLFAGESMFHRERDASKVALVGLVDLLRRAGGSGRLLDVQWATEHLVRLGAVELSRPTYLAMLSRALELPPPDFADTASSPG